MAAGTVYVNGVLRNVDDAKVSVLDRGFLYGDAVYETLRIYSGVPFKLTEHLSRLQASAQTLFLTIPFDNEKIQEIVGATIRASGLMDAMMRIMVTRGQSGFGLDLAAAKKSELIVMVLPLPHFAADIYLHGIKVISVEGFRRGGVVTPLAKVTASLGQMLALHEAKIKNADDAILLNEAGFVAEGTTSNLFAWINGCWHTPSVDSGILAGITRQTLLAAAQRVGLRVVERMFSLDELQAAKEIFLCSSVREIVGVVSLNGHVVGQGHVGSQTRQMQILLQRETRDASQVQ